MPPEVPAEEAPQPEAGEPPGEEAQPGDRAPIPEGPPEHVPAEDVPVPGEDIPEPQDEKEMREGLEEVIKEALNEPSFERNVKPRGELGHEELLKRAVEAAGKSIDEVPDSPGMELDVTGLERGLVRKLEGNGSVPSLTRRRIEAAIEKSIEQEMRAMELIKQIMLEEGTSRNGSKDSSAAVPPTTSEADGVVGRDEDWSPAVGI